MNFQQLVWIQHSVGAGWNVAQDPVVWAAVDLLDAVWRDTTDYVGVGGRGSDQNGKYEAVGTFLRHAIGKCQIFIPTVSLENGKAVFTDGRHRFAWLRDHGLRVLPVEVDEDSAGACRTCFGTSERVGRFDPGMG
ncbi:hypothetical protein [Burkholderia gladioli]|uniref:hypothetical protein n=1 Tax=Burkholderia gladioli TaxID=28095 RepID=UPI001640CBDB|nr:hypothetical protein [Burkholderia gladioli]MBU9172470.1 hypothetical protein [Burkholderia gladioli]MBU9385527.1 hypothetical protein [Burkholderia gladioli]MDN7807185.1 hypothetical protein [Burkholderia gladioli]